ncbi:MAG: hypothetical protein NXH87_08835 [Rhodobiaceae bacterium]|nr:hypothetical protein [Rhodobiaceae bacterium]
MDIVLEGEWGNVAQSTTLILFCFTLLLGLLSFFGSKKVYGLPLYFVALIFSLWSIIGVVGLGPWLAPEGIVIVLHLSIAELFSGGQNTSFASLSLHSIAGELSFISFALLNVLIASSAPQHRLSRLLTCYGAGLLGAAIGTFEDVWSVFEPNMSLWAQSAVVPPLLISLKILHNHTNYYAIKAPTFKDIQYIKKVVASSASLWKILTLITLVELSFMTGWFYVGGNTLTYYAASFFVVGIAMVGLGIVPNKLTATPTQFAIRGVQISFALIFISSAAQRFDLSYMSSWFGLFGSNGLEIASLGLLAWYLNSVDEGADHAHTPDYPKFVLIFLVVQALPGPLFSSAFSRLLPGSTAADFLSVFGLLATSALLVALLAWAPGRADR